MKFVITNELKGAWETWIVEVPDGTTADQIGMGDVEFDYFELLDAGHENATIVSAEVYE